MWASSRTACTRYQCQWHLVVAVGTVFFQSVECWHCYNSSHPLLYVGILTHCVHQISMSVASGCSRGDCFFPKCRMLALLQFVAPSAVGILLHSVHQISMSVASGCSRSYCFFNKMSNVGTATIRRTLCCMWASSRTACTRYQCQWHLVVAVGTVFFQNVECWHCYNSSHPLLYVGILTHCVHQISMSVASGSSRGDCFFPKCRMLALLQFVAPSAVCGHPHALRAPDINVSGIWL